MMANKKDSKLNYHEEENAMVTDLDDLKELGKEMEQISLCHSYCYSEFDIYKRFSTCFRRFILATTVQNCTTSA